MVFLKVPSQGMS